MRCLILFLFFLSCFVPLAGLFEQRVDQYLEELPDTEQSGVNKFLKGLGESRSRHTRRDRFKSGCSCVSCFARLKTLTQQDYISVFQLLIFATHLLRADFHNQGQPVKGSN